MFGLYRWCGLQRNYQSIAGLSLVCAREMHVNSFNIEEITGGFIMEPGSMISKPHKVCLIELFWIWKAGYGQRM